MTEVTTSAPTQLSEAELIQQAEEVIEAHKQRHQRGVVALTELQQARGEEQYVLKPSEYLRRLRLKRAGQFNRDSKHRLMAANGFEPAPAPAEVAETSDALAEPVAASELDKPIPKALDSSTLPGEIQNNTLPETVNKTLNYTTVFGSTWESVKDTGREGWRERWALKALHEAGIVTYNPWSANWKESDATSEALGMATPSVIALRIENGDIKDGSLGSMLELGIALYSAVLRGQRVVISIEAGIENSLTDPGARAQLASLKESLDEAMREHPGYITREDDPDRFIAEVIKATQTQKDENKAMMPITSEELWDFYSQRIDRISKPKVKVLFGGAGDSFTKDSATVAELEAHRKEIEDIFGDSDHFEQTYLYRGIHKAPWDAAYASGKEEDFREAHRKEKGIKEDSDVVINMVPAQTRGMGFLNEIGIGLGNALEKGQPYALLLEDFNPDLYVQTELINKSDEVTTEMLSEMYHNPNLTPEAQTEAIAIMQLLKANPSELTFKRLKNSEVFRKTKQFRVIDNTRRGRVIAQEQMRNLAKSMPEVVPPSFARIDEVAPYTFSEDDQMQQVFELLNRVKSRYLEPKQTSVNQAQSIMSNVQEQRRTRLEAPAVPLFIFETDREKFKQRLQTLQQEIYQAQAAAKLAA